MATLKNQQSLDIDLTDKVFTTALAYSWCYNFYCNALQVIDDFSYKKESKKNQELTCENQSSQA